MSDFSVFMAGAKDIEETTKYVASKRFVENKKPVEWELKPISSSLDEAIRKECTKKVPVVGKRGQYTQEVDTDKYVGKLCVACTVYPNLNDAALLFFPKPSTFLKKQKRAHKEVWKTTSPENKNFSGKEK